MLWFSVMLGLVSIGQIINLVRINMLKKALAVETEAREKLSAEVTERAWVRHDRWHGVKPPVISPAQQPYQLDILHNTVLYVDTLVTDRTIKDHLAPYRALLEDQGYSLISASTTEKPARFEKKTAGLSPGTTT